jgi:nascent polypeptide-associated complex subunit alpha
LYTSLADHEGIPSYSHMEKQEDTQTSYMPRKFYNPENIWPPFSEQDADIICKQTGVDKEKARKAIREAKGDLARAILLLTMMKLLF